jgi:hypothetical protein
VNVALFVGLVIATVGAVFALTVIDTAEEVVVALKLSVAFAVMEYVPAVTELQTNEYGLVRSSPIFVDPL